MSTGFDVSTEDLVAQLGETVERGASLLATGSRLAGPAGPQDSPGELIPGDPSTCVGVGLRLDDGSIVAVAITHAFAVELCGGVAAEQVVSGLQVVTEQLAGGTGRTAVESVWLADGTAIEGFLSGHPVLLGAGIFDGDSVVGTVGAAPAAVGASSAGVPGGTMSSAPAGQNPNAAGTPATGNVPSTTAGVGSTVSDAVLARGLALLADVNLELTVELGRAHLRVSDLLSLEPGSVIDLEREAGSPVDLLVNGTLFARAEVIVVENNYAVRITELVAKDLTA